MPSPFHYHNDTLHAESVNLEELAEVHGTPLYVYSRSALERQYQRYQSSFASHPHLICYAVKANSNLAILNYLAQLGSGFDVVSGGELKRVLTAGGKAQQIIFSGVAKTIPEMEMALEAGIHSFNIESAAEMEQLSVVAHANGAVAKIAIRINPDIQAGTHPHVETGTATSKFGVPLLDAEQLYLKAAESEFIKIQGIDCHIGSQIIEFTPILQALNCMLELTDKLNTQGIRLQHINLGGGLGLRTHPDTGEYDADIEGFGKSVCAHLNNTQMQLILEPGRSLIASAGALLMRVRYLKKNSNKKFAVVDAGMSHFMRPALYNATHPIISVKMRTSKQQYYDVVGPVCESADTLGQECALAINQGDLLAICMAGAYGSVMSSNYNSLTRAEEVLVHRDKTHVIHRREKTEELWRYESIPKILA